MRKEQYHSGWPHGCPHAHADTHTHTQLEAINESKITPGR